MSDAILNGPAQGGATLDCAALAGASAEPSERSSTDTPSARLAFQLYVAIGVGVFLLMMVVGALFRATQAAFAPIPANFAYELMTLHGAGMVGVSGLAGSAVMWYFLRRYVALSTGMFLAMLSLSLVGVVMILAAIGLGRFAGGWTFLYPLPANSMGVWGPHAAAAFVGGLVFIGVGFLLFYLDCAAGILRRYGSLARALGLDQLFGLRPLDTSLPPTVVASTMVIIVNMHRHPCRRSRSGDEPGQHLRAEPGVRRAADEEPDLLLRPRLHQRDHLHGRHRRVRDRSALQRTALAHQHGVPRLLGRGHAHGHGGVSASPADGLRDAEMDGSNRPGALVPERHPDSSRDGVRRAGQHPSFRPEVGPAACAC